MAAIDAGGVMGLTTGYHTIFLLTYIDDFYADTWTGARLTTGYHTIFLLTASSPPCGMMAENRIG
ncbi:MAG TPA: hypothetical protein GYA08_18535 [Chloroflexi bacterium]|nr:hypothetical protein [Chloroflexota bacterium]